MDPSLCGIKWVDSSAKIMDNYHPPVAAITIYLQLELQLEEWLWAGIKLYIFSLTTLGDMGHKLQH